MQFEWDTNKEKINLKKHGISFNEAKQALTCVVVVVVYPEETTTRIISARKANKRERKIYEAQL